MDKIQAGNAPCSWGTLEFEGLQANPVGYRQMLDELVETGYTATELGDWGFMPTNPGLLREEIERRKLTLLGAFTAIGFKYSEKLAAGKKEALKIARLLAAASPEHKPYLILADDNNSEPDRSRLAGRVTPNLALKPEEWKTFARNVEEIARAVNQETGLPVLFHHHCAGYVETETEMERFLDLTNPALVNFVFDTGHFVFGSGPDSQYTSGNIVPVLEKFSSRISYIHFKDCHPDIAARSRREEWPYLTSLRNGIFCELGRGCIDFKGVLEWLQKRGYQGWVLVEQDILPGMGSPKESARRNRDYLSSIGL